MTVRVQKWGNSLGVRIPKSVARQSEIREGVELEIICTSSGVNLQPVKTPSLKQLLAQAKRKNRPELIDWSKPRGREVW